MQTNWLATYILPFLHKYGVLIICVAVMGGERDYASMCTHMHGCISLQIWRHRKDMLHWTSSEKMMQMEPWKDTRSALPSWQFTLTVKASWRSAESWVEISQCCSLHTEEMPLLFELFLLLLTSQSWLCDFYHCGFEIRQIHIAPCAWDLLVRHESRQRRWGSELMNAFFLGVHELSNESYGIWRRGKKKKEVQWIIIIWAHDAQITGLFTDRADYTITETCIYGDDVLMMNEGESGLGRLGLVAAARIPPHFLRALFLPSLINSSVRMCLMFEGRYIRVDHRVISIAIM